MSIQGKKEMQNSQWYFMVRIKVFGRNETTEDKRLLETG